MSWRSEAERDEYSWDAVVDDDDDDARLAHWAHGDHTQSPSHLARL